MPRAHAPRLSTPVWTVVPPSTARARVPDALWHSGQDRAVELLQEGRGEMGKPLRWKLVRGWRGARRRIEDGMTTAEYAVGTLAAVAFAAALIAVVKSDAVRSALARIIQSALSTG